MTDRRRHLAGRRNRQRPAARVHLVGMGYSDLARCALDLGARRDRHRPLVHSRRPDRLLQGQLQQLRPLPALDEPGARHRAREPLPRPRRRAHHRGRSLVLGRHADARNMAPTASLHAADDAGAEVVVFDDDAVDWVAIAAARRAELGRRVPPARARDGGRPHHQPPAPEDALHRDLDDVDEEPARHRQPRRPTSAPATSTCTLPASVEPDRGGEQVQSRRRSTFSTAGER